MSEPHARPVLTGARWSEATRCPRMSALGLLGAIPAAPSDRLERLFRRGKDVEHAWIEHLASEYSGTIMREPAITWGQGWEMHPDVVLPNENPRAHIEIKSTVKVDELPGVPVEINGFKTTSAVLQVAGAAILDPEGGTAELVTVSPVDYWERRWPITITPELRAAVIHVESDVVQAASTGELPARCCSKPSDAQGRFCPYRDACFSMEPEYVEPEPVPLDGDLALETERRLKGAEKWMADATLGLKEAKQARDDERALARWRLNLEPGTEYEIGETRVKISTVKGRETFDYRAAIASGNLTIDTTLEPFVKRGEPSERWTCESLSEENA